MGEEVGSFCGELALAFQASGIEVPGSQLGSADSLAGLSVSWLSLS